MPHPFEKQTGFLGPNRDTDDEIDIPHLLDHLPAGVMVHAADASILLANQEACRMLGLSCDLETGELRQNPGWEFVAEDLSVLSQDQHPVARILASRTNLENLVLGVRAPDRKEITWTLTNAYPDFDPDDDIRQIVVSFVDITERKRVEAALKESEFFFRESQRVTSLGSYKLDLANGTWESSEGLEQVFGIDKTYPRDVEGWLRLVHPDEADPMASYLYDEVIGKRQYFNRDYRIIRKSDGETRWVMGRGDLHFDGDGKPLTMIGIIQDITDRKLVDAERERLQLQLVQAQRMESIGRLAGGVAHDFNNMLGVMMGRAEEAMMKMDPFHPVFVHLKEILKAGMRSSDLTRQLLGFARRQTVTPKLLDLNDTIEGMLKMLRRLIGEHIEIVWRPSVDLHPVLIDPGQVDQILANLCVNARDAIVGSGKLTIETMNTHFDAEFCIDQPDIQPGPFIALAVSDDGCGMDADTRRQIFEPFFTTKEVGKGTGLGLSTLYGIVKQNRGLVNVYSEPGQGTTFKIYLPAKPGATAARRTPLPISVDRGDETILLVEDEPLLLSMTTEMLTGHGYTVEAAATGEQAIEMFRRGSDRIRLVVTDVVMPGMNGQKLVDQIRAIRPGLPALFMSGYTSNIIDQHGVVDEGFRFVQKPFSMQVFLGKVRDALGR